MDIRIKYAEPPSWPLPNTTLQLCGEERERREVDRNSVSDSEYMVYI
jgi:hypothetical protein